MSNGTNVEISESSLDGTDLIRHQVAIPVWHNPERTGAVLDFSTKDEVDLDFIIPRGATITLDYDHAYQTDRLVIQWDTPS